MSHYAQLNPCKPSSPPIPLILAAWTATNDLEKKQRWEETIAWAETNGCSHLVSCIPDQDFYFVEKPTDYMVGPLGVPMYRTWDFETKTRPSSEQIVQLMGILRSHWLEIVGSEIGSITRPLAFTGDKARRLLVFANASFTPPWGGWSYLSRHESERRTFTHFRTAINTAIAPHEVDHIDFITDEKVLKKR
ncbi:hypothetical protein JW926_04765 [Candidatus Sumerlaeota bacterium]|nr:hypothetical protein [Candidatus Sumerlaeota bacterium]